MRATILIISTLVVAAACAAEGPAPDPQAGASPDGPAAGAPDTTAPGPGAPTPGDTSPSSGAFAGGAEWTAGVTHVERPQVGVATVVAARIARQEGFERFVLELAAGDTLPGYHIEYIDRPVRACGSGDVVDLPGDGWLSIRLEPARGHSEEGRTTLRERRLVPRQTVVREAVVTCDFEAQLEWVLGVSSPNRYRVTELSDPARLVVDIRSD